MRKSKKQFNLQFNTYIVHDFEGHTEALLKNELENYLKKLCAIWCACPTYHGEDDYLSLYNWCYKNLDFGEIAQVWEIEGLTGLFEDNPEKEYKCKRLM